jgi:glycosyltransferase involved in cell wall biosynthesis
VTTATGLPAVSVVLPCHNESDALLSLVPEIAAVLRGLELDYEIIVVDDGSSDSTLAAVATLSSNEPGLCCLSHAKRRGQSAALLTGVAAARARWIVTLDGDGQNDPADIPRLWAHAASHSSERPLLVTGQRTHRKDGVRRLVLSRALNLWSAVILGHPVMDKSCGLRVFQRHAYLALPVFDHMHRFLPGLFRLLDGELHSVRVGHRPRKHGRSHYTNLPRLMEGVIDVFGILWLKKRYLAPIQQDGRRSRGSMECA